MIIVDGIYGEPSGSARHKDAVVDDEIAPSAEVNITAQVQDRGSADACILLVP